MGSQNSKFLSDQELPQEYRPLDQSPGIYESILNGNRLQQHRIELYSQAEITHEKQIFVFRRMHAERVITAFFFQKFLPSHFCNMSYQVTFFTEHPSLAFSLDLIFSIEKAFHLLIESLQGFYVLFSRFGAFSISQNNIFFNSHNELKVWISPDLGKTRVDPNSSLDCSQERMVLDIFTIFDRVRDPRSNQITFSNYLWKLRSTSKSELSFRNTIGFLLDEGSKFFKRKLKVMSIYKTEKENPKKKTILNKSFKYQGKQLKQNTTISLKTKNSMKKMIKNPSTAQTSSNFPTLQGEQIFKEEENSDFQKSKFKCNSKDNFVREIHYHRRSSNKGTLFIKNNRYTHLTAQTEEKSSQPITLRLHRKSIDVEMKGQEHITKRLNSNHMGEIQTNHQDNRHCHNCKRLRTEQWRDQQQKHEFLANPTLQKKTTLSTSQNFYLQNIASSTQTLDPPICHRIMRLGLTQIQGLSNLHTFKSIVNSQYSDLDSQIREDLQKMSF